MYKISLKQNKKTGAYHFAVNGKVVPQTSFKTPEQAMQSAKDYVNSLKLAAKMLKDYYSLLDSCRPYSLME